MSENRSGSSGLLIGGVLLGAAVGAVAGLLFAPKAGRETRQLLRKSADALPELAEDLSTSVQIQAERLSSSALRNWDDTLGRVRNAILVGIDVSQRQRQVLTQPELTLNSPQSPLPDQSPLVDPVRQNDSYGNHSEEIPSSDPDASNRGSSIV